MKYFTIGLLFLFCSQNLTAQKKVAIYWDASYSMSDRLLDRELQYLDNYFKKYTNSDVGLVVFSNDIILRENYSVVNGNWDRLKLELEKTIYDGATSYDNLFKDGYDECLLFTDGIENLNNLKPPTNKPVHIISTTADANIINLKLISGLSSGTYINLKNQIAQPNEKKYKNEKVEVFGSISSAEGVLANVNIVNKNTNGGATSLNNGSYKIAAKAGDLLVFTFLGKKTVNIRVSNTNNINISMQDIGENLDEVVITADVEKEELVNTGNTTVNKRSLGYTTESIGEESISAIDTDIKQAVAGQFSNLELSGNNGASTKLDLSKFLGRGKNMTITGNQYGLVVVDGVPMQTSDSSVFNGKGVSQTNQEIGATSLSHISPEMIHSITYLKGLAATNKYGTLGANGVLLIVTKNAVAGKDYTKKKIKLGTTATYSGSAQAINELANTEYIENLKASKNIEDAFDNYLNQRKTHGHKPEFYLDVYDYFQGWENDLLSDRILSNVLEIAFDDVNILKALSYKQQAGGDYKGAVVTLKRVLKLKPNQAQSYRDLALAEVYASNYQDALKLYDKVDKNRGVGSSNFSGIKKTIVNDTKNLITQHQSELNTTGINSLFLKPIKYKARIIFEWNNLNSEFDLNIINPQKRFFTWSHTNSENAQRIKQENEMGYGLEEFYLSSSDIGEWTFNMKYYGKTAVDETPTFVKITIYKNFGSPNETKEIKVIRLDKKNIEQTVVKLLVK